jgi:hypothetical protein
LALLEHISFQDISTERVMEPEYAQIWVHYNPSERPLSRIVVVIESYGGDVVKVQVHPSAQNSMKVARFYLANQDVSHIVIGLIENLEIEARGCGPSAPTGRQA